MNKWDSQSACFSINPICLDAYCSIIAKYCAEYDYEGDNENYDFFISFNANTFFIDIIFLFYDYLLVIFFIFLLYDYLLVIFFIAFYYFQFSFLRFLPISYQRFEDIIY